MAAPVSNITFSNFSATTAAFTLLNGVYSFGASGTWSSGSLALAALGPDGSTYLPISTLSANGINSPVYCPTGSYKLVVSGSPSALYAQVQRVPLVVARD